MTTKEIEELATNAVKRSILTSGYLSQFIAENDKEPSWDGFVYIYDIKKKQKKHFRGRVPVQIKGTMNKGTVSDIITYPVSTTDLNNYLYDGGVIFFVVYLSADGSEDHIYYATLSPVKLTALLDACKAQKTKTIILKTFPTTGDKKSTVFLQFYTDCKKQSSFKSSDMLTIDGDEIQKDIDTISVSVNSFGSTNADVQNAFFENEVYLYGRKVGSDLPIPFKIIPENLHTMHEYPCNISLNGKVFYTSFSIIRSKKSTTVKIGKSFFIIVDRDGKISTIEYKPTAMLRDHIRDCEFMIAILANKGFLFGETLFALDPTDKELQSFHVEDMQMQINYLKDIQSVLDLLNVKKDIDINKLSRTDKRELDNLITAFVKKDPVPNLKKDLSSICKIKIQDITLALVFEKVKGEEGMYCIYDFFKSNLTVLYSKRGSANELITSQYSLLSAEDYCVIDNIDFDMIIPSYQRLVAEYPNIVNRAACDMLNMLLAYDKTSKKELLSIAE